MQRWEVHLNLLISMADEGWSRKLCKVLRHRAPEYGLEMGHDGYVSVEALLSHTAFRGLTVTQLKRIVAENKKSRFVLRTSPETGMLMIRAAQGHSIPVDDDLLLERIVSKEQLPKITVHATSYKKWLEICKSGGLCAMKRNHIHMTSYPECLGNSSAPQIRASADVLVVIDAAMAFDHGIPFFWSTNKILLTPGAPATPGWLPKQYLIGAMTRTGEPIA